MKGVIPETILSQEQLEQIRDCVLCGINRTAAYAITSYVDWLCYCCIRYIEGGGIDDLSHIEKGVCFTLDVPWELREKVINDVYFIIRPILIDAEKYRQADIHPKWDVKSAVEFMVKNCKDVKWDIITRAMRVMESGIESNKPMTDKLLKIMKGYNV